MFTNSITSDEYVMEYTQYKRFWLTESPFCGSNYGRIIRWHSLGMHFHAFLHLRSLGHLSWAQSTYRPIGQGSTQVGVILRIIRAVGRFPVALFLAPNQRVNNECILWLGFMPHLQIHRHSWRYFCLWDPALLYLELLLSHDSGVSFAELTHWNTDYLSPFPFRATSFFVPKVSLKLEIFVQKSSFLF